MRTTGVRNDLNFVLIYMYDIYNLSSHWTQVIIHLNQTATVLANVGV